MKDIILQTLQVWDPYGLYLFPKDEYSDFVNPIFEFLLHSKNATSNDLAYYLFELIPPIEKITSTNIVLAEYERVSKLLLMIVQLSN
jgi:hypothetical protein